MQDFWPSSGHVHLERTARGWLKPTDAYLRTFLALPELALVEESCSAEVDLHHALVAAPTRAVRQAELNVLLDADARSNVAVSLAFRDGLLAAAWYLTRGNVALGLAVSACVGALVLMAHRAADGSIGAWLTWGVGVFVIGWLIQFAGHWYEGRKPAFVDDIIGLLVGPMFVTAEAMFTLGWNKPLQAEIERRAGPTLLRDMAKIA